MNYLTTVKNTFKNKDRKTENLILLLVLLVILLISINYIFKTEDKNSNNTSSASNINNSVESSESSNNLGGANVEEKLENILSKINGIEDVSVMLTYSTASKQNVVYNTKEETNNEQSKTEKSVAYNEESGKKTAIVESTEMPKVEGIIIVAKGANSVEIKSKIATAAAMAVNVPVYKVQVFEK